VIWQSECDCVSLLYEKDCGRQKNPLHLESMMISELSSSSIGYSTGSLLLDYPSTLRPYHPKEVASIEETNRRLSAAYRYYLSRHVVVVTISVEDGRAWNWTPFLRLYPSIFRTTRTSYRETETPMVATLVAFAFSKVIDESFSTIGGKHAIRIPVFGAERICFFLSVFLYHLCIVA
jgi:hypothetical protein